MKQIIIIASILLSTLSFAKRPKIPRQKVYLQGKVKEEKVFKMDDLAKLDTVEVDIIDPYSTHQKIKFTGIYLHKLHEQFAMPEAKVMDIFAINDYKVEITVEDAKKEKMLLAFKGDGEYLSVAQRGPARIVIPGKGKIKEGALAKEGIKWVWFVKTIIFK